MTTPVTSNKQVESSKHHDGNGMLKHKLNAKNPPQKSMHSDDAVTFTSNEESSPDVPSSTTKAEKSLKEHKVTGKKKTNKSESSSSSSTPESSSSDEHEKRTTTPTSKKYFFSDVVMSLLHFGSRSQTVHPGDQATYEELSSIGRAVYDKLWKVHRRHKKESWNLTKSAVVGRLWNTPREAFTENRTKEVSSTVTASSCPSQPHDEWLPRQMGDIIARTTKWCDITSLTPPDGFFLEHFQRGLMEIYKRQSEKTHDTKNNNSNPQSSRITIRLMFGNILGTPIDCNSFIRVLTNRLPEDAGNFLQIWVGSWRKKASWNHSKIIAVDGTHLWTGGHNLWTYHYCMADPVHDVSLELEGAVATDGHLFANRQWKYIQRKQSSCWGHFVDKHVPDDWEVPRIHRVTVSEYPFHGAGASEFPPLYDPVSNLDIESPKLKAIKAAKDKLLQTIRSSIDTSESEDHQEKGEHIHGNEFDVNRGRGDGSSIPILSIGRYRTIVHRDRPADDALVAMMDAAQSTIRLAIQDLGPMQIPGTSRPFPGTRWPKQYLNALARALWKRRVDIEIILSNPDSLPGHLDGPGEFVYGNGWAAHDVASEIIKAIRKQFRFKGVNDEDLYDRISNNLRICYLRRLPERSREYDCGQPIGLHAKHYIFDDKVCYIGSNNLYDCDLAEWGVILDSTDKVQEFKTVFWNKMWKASFREADCPIDRVLDGLDIRREAPTRLHLFKWMLDARFRQQQGKDSEGLSPTPSTSTSSRKAAIFSPFRWTCCRSTEAAVQQEDHYHPNNA